MPREYDVIVAGAGPAGTSSAQILARCGHRVLLVDKERFPRDKPCGGGVTFKCREPLERLGLWDAFRKTSPFCARGYSLCFSDFSQLSVRWHDADPRSAIYITRRQEFDLRLLEAALSYDKVRFAAGCKVKDLLWSGTQVCGVRLEGGEHAEHRAPLVIDATGAAATLVAKAGLLSTDPKTCALAVRGYFSGMRHLDESIELYFDEIILPGYYWIFPVSSETANIGCGSFQHIIQNRRVNLRKLLEGFLRNHRVASRKARDAVPCGPLRAGRIPLAMEHDRSRVGDGLLAVGDAAAFVNPVTAEGISYALISGIMAAEVGAAALARGEFSRSALEAYDALWNARFGDQFGKSVFLTGGLPPDAYSQYVVASLKKSASVEAAQSDPGKQYELMVKLKAIMKSL